MVLACVQMILGLLLGMILSGMVLGKLSHLIESMFSENDPKFAAWDEDSIIMS